VTDLLLFDGMSMKMEPAITKWGFEDLQDDPENHRWRAWWALSDDYGITGGIELRAYPVIKVNPMSVWIDEWACRDWQYGEGDPFKDWVSCKSYMVKKRLCHNGSGSAWAKPTQDEAIRSLAIRLCRWTSHIANDIRRAKSAIDALQELRPDLSSYAEKSRQNILGATT
jgi:hypothetical protein